MRFSPELVSQIIRLFRYAVLTWSLVGVFVRVADFVVLFFVRGGTRSCEDDLDTSTVTRLLFFDLCFALIFVLLLWLSSSARLGRAPALS